MAKKKLPKDLFGERYPIIKVIGSGDTSVVFGVYDTVKEQTVALKMLRPEYNNDPVVSERFATEIRIMSRLSHPNIVKIYDVNTEGEYRYFTMEYMAGVTLKDHLESRGALPLEELLFFSRQILSALAAIHREGVVHSDIKPQNIIILPDGQVRLMDFGISRTTEKEKKARTLSADPAFEAIFNSYDLEESPEDQAVGSVHYISPEQAQGQSIDHLSDIYSFGILLYEMATGTLPFNADQPQRLVSMHVHEHPLAPSLIQPELAPGLEKVILRALEKLPVARFTSAEEMSRALDAVEQEYQDSLIPHPPEVLTPWQKFCRFAIDTWHGFTLPSFITGALCALLVTVVAGLSILSGALVAEREEPTHIKIPALAHRPLQEVMAELDDEAYAFEITYTEHGEPGRIVSQSPRAGQVVSLPKDGPLTLKVTVALQQLPPTMPDLRYLSAKEILDLLASYDCEVTVEELPHDMIAQGYVLGTAPAAGESTDHKITVYVSAGPQKE